MKTFNYKLVTEEYEKLYKTIPENIMSTNDIAQIIVYLLNGIADNDILKKQYYKITLFDPNDSDVTKQIIKVCKHNKIVSVLEKYSSRNLKFKLSLFEYN